MAVPLYKTALAVFVADDAVPVVEAVPAVVAAIKCQPCINHRVLAPKKKIRNKLPRLLKPQKKFSVVKRASLTGVYDNSAERRKSGGRNLSWWTQVAPRHSG